MFGDSNNLLGYINEPHVQHFTIKVIDQLHMRFVPTLC
jgi:hypothetical protein